MAHADPQATNRVGTIDHAVETTGGLAVKGVFEATAAAAVLYGAALGALYLARKGLSALSRHRSHEAAGNEVVAPPGSSSF
jgi:hypothetical protein